MWILSALDERRDPLEERPHLRVALVAVLGAAEVAAIALGVLQERDEVRDADDVDARLDPVVVGRLHGQRHEAAVRAADHADAGLVEIRLLGDPVEQGADVLDGVLAELAVVELQIGLAVARRAPHVGEDQDDAQLVDQVVEPAQERRAELALGTAVDVDQDRPRAGKLPRRRAIDERRDLAAVEARILDQLGLGEGLGSRPPVSLEVQRTDGRVRIDGCRVNKRRPAIGPC